MVTVDRSLSAHVFDEIGPKLRDQFHVYAVTRRGIGASDRPTVGYDPQRRADDIVEVMAALGLRKPILVGNACGWHVLQTLGGQHPDRVGALVYLDAAEDPTIKLSEYALPPADRVNIDAFRGKPVPVTFPPAEEQRLKAQPIDPGHKESHHRGSPRASRLREHQGAQRQPLHVPLA
jgi:pimeloyl-ACP methyl ester carboxylesterase